MIETAFRIVTMNTNPAVRDALAIGGNRAEILTPRSEAELRRCLDVRADVVVLGFEQAGMTPGAVLRVVAAAPHRPSIILLLDAQWRLKHLQRIAAKLGLGRLAHATNVSALHAAVMDARQIPRPFAPDASDLRHALDQHELVLHYQLKLDCVDNRSVVGVEALIRWAHPHLGLLLPSHIISLAEHSGLLTEVTDFTITEAVQQHVAWRNHGIDLPVAINLAPGLIRDDECADRLLNSLGQFDVSPSRLTLEIKETESVTDRDLCVGVLERLRRAGVGIALDDYGAGLSSITELYRLPFTEVKIDRDLIVDAAQNRAAHVVLRSIVRLAHELDIDATGEGVETRTELATVAAAGCDCVQGALLFEPKPPGQVEQFLRSSEAGFQTKRPVVRTTSWSRAAH